ncbi:MAG TPA: VTT domain-containing protein, partial [Acidiferrobacteraceae bacterium]|nr:VTT domain-containing protein [Acidiferrobacteraceae bacterium]
EQRLQEANGPEVVMVLPLTTADWLQESTMGILRTAAIQRLTAADRYRRLGIFYPQVPGLNEDCVKVHAKITIIDDHIARIGSANLNNRSMSLDSECDIAIATAGDPVVCAAIAGLRNRLLGEHLGRDPADIAAASGNPPSLLRTIRVCGGSERTLAPLPNPLPDDLELLVAKARLGDRSHPMETTDLIREFVPREVKEHAPRGLIRTAVAIGILLLLAAAWHWTGLRDWLSPQHVVQWARTVRGTAWAPALVLCAYVTGGLVMFPITILIIATTLTFPAPENFLYAFAGTLLSTTVTYFLGRALGREGVARFSKKHFRKLARQFTRRGLTTILTLRIVPVAPHSIVNIAAGALRVPYRDLLLGTALGILPGLFAVTVFTNRLAALVRQPGLGNFALAAALIAALAAAGVFLKRWFTRSEQTTNPRPQA